MLPTDIPTSPDISCILFSLVTVYNIEHILYVFVICRIWQLPTAWMIIDTHKAITKMFMSLVNLCFFLMLYFSSLSHVTYSVQWRYAVFRAT
jgi:hypothetical protein